MLFRSVSGDTSAGGLRRADWSLEGDVSVLIVALGGNDGLRGLPPAELKKNLKAIVDKAKARGIKVILAGMEAPPNNGADYTREFRAVYPELAREEHVTLIPFLLQGVAGDPTAGPIYQGPCCPRTGTHDDCPHPRAHRVYDRFFDWFYTAR